MTDPSDDTSQPPVSEQTKAAKKPKKRFLFWGRKTDEDTSPPADPEMSETGPAEHTAMTESAPHADGGPTGEGEGEREGEAETAAPPHPDPQMADPGDRAQDLAMAEHAANLGPEPTDQVATAAEQAKAAPASNTETAVDDPEPAPKKKGFFQRLKEGLNKSSSKLSEGVTGIFTKRKLDDETLEELEDLLVSSDLGVSTASKISTRLAAGRYNKEISPEDVRAVLADEIVKVLETVEQPFEIKAAHKPHIVLMVGVNGTGKTTTIGKLASKAAHNGYKPMMAAGDTFRAAAIEQLKIWGERTGTPVVARDVGADAAGLAFDAIEQARREQSDVLFIDTAGRLQNKANLMAELEKVIRVIKKLDPSAPHDVLLVLDATTGQNAVSQVEAFRETAGVTGLVMTKLDGTARGGILVAIAEKFGLPVHAIGVGETTDDLQAFEARAFADALVGREVLGPRAMQTDAA